MDKPLALGPNIGRKATCSQYNSIAYLMLQCSRCFKSYRGLTNFYTNVISLLNSATVLEFNLCEAQEKFRKSSLLDNLEHSGLDENEGDGERVSAAAVDQALERLLRIELAEVVGQAGGCRLADHLKQGWTSISSSPKCRFLRPVFQSPDKSDTRAKKDQKDSSFP